MESFLKWCLFVGILVYLFYKYSSIKLSYWKKKGVKYLKPTPFVGNNDMMGLGSGDVLKVCKSFYEPFKGHRFGGLYVKHTPFLSIVDPDLLKQVMVKDADHFLNRYDWFVGTDPLLCNNLVNLKDEKWKKMRAVMTTVFTSAKMKDMFGFMNKCGEQAVNHLEQKFSEHLKTGNNLLEMEFRDFFSRYGTDVIGSTAFGIEVDSFKNPNNEFYTSGLVIRNLFSGWQMIKFIFMTTFPKLTKALGISALGDKYTKFFVSLIEDTIREREEKNIVRKDVIHILMEARKERGVDENGELIKGKLPELTDFDIAAQAVVFFFGGFETMASLLGFVVHELAMNPDVQEKLQQEIDEVIERENGMVTYEGVIHQMNYLNMVINETLRKWPPAVMTDRQVTKEYVIPKSENSPELILKKGDSVWIPIVALHYDSEYFPNPEKFDPERFREEKNTIKPFTFLPFGEGLRHCVGMRYALMETKTILVHLLRKFKLEPSTKTLIPMKLSKRKPFVLEPETGYWLGVKPRK